MKKPIPVTIYDLECTARDDERGIAKYLNVQVYFDDAQNDFSYSVDNIVVSRVNAEAILELRQ